MNPPAVTGLTDPLVQAMARAATGEPEAIERLASTPGGVDTVIRNRLAPLLASVGYEHGLAIPDGWQLILRQIAIMRMLLERGLHDLGSVLDPAGIPWLPLKGMGPVAGLYPSPECRPTTDLDVLVPEEGFPEVRELLRAQGWVDLHPGPLHEDFLLREGYNWQARHTTGVMLELHFRLWGPVDPNLPAVIVDAARPAPELGTMARLSPPAESYIVAACHLWNSPQPVVLLYFLDLHLLARAADEDPDFVETVIAMAKRHDLQLFVGLAATVAAQLWPNEYNEAIATALLDDLRPAERAVVASARWCSPLVLPLGTLVLARLLSGRKSRSGWRAPFRRIWPHPAIFQESLQRGPIPTFRRKIAKIAKNR